MISPFLFLTFQVPLVPLIPFLSIVINVVLILNLKPLTWIRLGIWMAIGKNKIEITADDRVGLQAVANRPVTSLGHLGGPNVF